jgi:hypothetical protein
MGVIACGSLDCLGATLGLGPLHRSLSTVSPRLGSASEPAGILLNALEPRCGPRPIGPESPRGLADWRPR